MPKSNLKIMIHTLLNLFAIFYVIFIIASLLNSGTNALFTDTTTYFGTLSTAEVFEEESSEEIIEEEVGKEEVEERESVEEAEVLEEEPAGIETEEDDPVETEEDEDVDEAIIKEEELETEDETNE